jgi:hypothetical protein
MSDDESRSYFVGRKPATRYRVDISRSPASPNKSWYPLEISQRPHRKHEETTEEIKDQTHARYAERLPLHPAMDAGESNGGSSKGFDDDVTGPEWRKKELPADLPKSLDDRRRVPTELVQETELYDGWQGKSRLRKNHNKASRSRFYLSLCLGQSQFLTSPMLAKPLTFGELSLNDATYDEDLTRGGPDSEARLMEMLAAQAAHSAGAGFEDADVIASDEKYSDQEKKDLLQKALTMAASNGNVESVKKILEGKAKSFVDVNAPDEDGTPPLIYASCFVRETLPPRHDMARGYRTDAGILGTRERGSGIDNRGSQRRQARS